MISDVSETIMEEEEKQDSGLVETIEDQSFDPKYESTRRGTVEMSESPQIKFEEQQKKKSVEGKDKFELLFEMMTKTEENRKLAEKKSEEKRRLAEEKSEKNRIADKEEIKNLIIITNRKTIEKNEENLEKLKKELTEDIKNKNEIINKRMHDQHTNLTRNMEEKNQEMKQEITSKLTELESKVNSNHEDIDAIKTNYSTQFELINKKFTDVTFKEYPSVIEEEEMKEIIVRTLNEQEEHITKKMEENFKKFKNEEWGQIHESHARKTEEIEKKQEQVEKGLNDKLKFHLERVCGNIQKDYENLKLNIEKNKEEIDECQSVIKGTHEYLKTIRLDPKQECTEQDYMQGLVQELNLNFNTNRLPRFFGDGKHNPKSLIHNLKHTTDKIKDIAKIKSILRSVMKGDAENWFGIVEEHINCFQDFQNLFLKHYWGEVEQQKVRDNLISGKYRGFMDQSRVNYATRKKKKKKSLPNKKYRVHWKKL